jgi:hypothetical protein
MGNRLYYRGKDAVVTDRLFVWQTTPTKGFVIHELHNVGLVHTSTARLRLAIVPVAGFILVTQLAAWTTLTVPIAAVTSVVAAAVLLLAIAVTGRRPRRWELHATYRGKEVVLYANADPRIFNQVARALRRAVEDGRRSMTARSPGQGVAVA